jgi:hypothetical protein
MTTPVLDVLRHITQPLNPTAYGLYSATDWQPASGPARFLHGVEVKGPNYGGEGSFGAWDVDWCSVPPVDGGDKKEGDRPDPLDPFDAITVWAYDECDPTPASRTEIAERAAQVLRLEEQTAVERTFAERLKLDANDLPGVLATAADLRLAVGYLEAQTAMTNTVGYFHVGAQWASQELGLFLKSGTRWVSPLGNIWIVGGGYVDGLDDIIVATSQPVGWRDAPTTRTALDALTNRFVAVAERSVTIGYEAVIAAVQIT